MTNPALAHPFYRLHSGGVVRNGAGVLFVGPSGAGKSTLVLRLVTDGFSLLSDDEVWIDPKSLLLHASNRNFLLKETAWDLFPMHREKFVPSGEKSIRSWWLDPEHIRRGCRAGPSPLSTLVLLKARSGDYPVLAKAGQTEVLNDLLRESMNFPEFRTIGLSTLVSITKNSSLFSLTLGELDECVKLLLKVLP